MCAFVKKKVKEEINHWRSIIIDVNLCEAWREKRQTDRQTDRARGGGGGGLLLSENAGALPLSTV